MRLRKLAKAGGIFAGQAVYNDAVSESGYVYAVVGAGMQGTAAAYDLARLGDAREVWICDFDSAKAQASAERVNKLVGRNIARAKHVDASRETSVAEGVGGAHVALSCVPYRLHATVEEGAIQAGVNVVDLGNDTDVTLKMLDRDAELVAKGITLVPDTGLAPGLVNSIGCWFLEVLDEVHDVRLYCGGLPQNPKPPLDYSLRFSIEGLVGEYVDEAIALRNHEVLRLETLQELEEVEIEGFGKMEAFTTSSGTSTAPYSFKDRIRNYDYKTLRHPGHCAVMRAFQQLGFWDEGAVDVDGNQVIPLHVFYKVAGDKLTDPNDKDLVIVHAIGSGVKDGRDKRIQVDIVDYQDDATGFAAMERLTGFSTSIVAIEVARGRVRKGCVPYETAVPGSRFLDEIRSRGIEVRVTGS